MAQTRLATARLVWGLIVALALLGCEGGGENRESDRAVALRGISYRLTTDQFFRSMSKIAIPC